MRTVHAAAVGLLTAALVGLVGCGGSDTAEVSGTASFDGVLIEKGSITFIPADGKSPTAGGAIENGKYSVAKVPVGKAKVSITGSKVVGKKQAYPGQPNSPVGDVTVNPIPAKFNDTTELTFDVQSGRNEKNWELKTK